ncbi:MAG: hypothetical protein KGR70_15565 [Cyanobacteria bacterium REEB494]|nr:hypothetical protein [Cyanobacteria bacterium REEB494]
MLRNRPWKGLLILPSRGYNVSVELSLREQSTKAMQSFTLQGVSSDLYNWLRQQAEAHQHTINDEVICLLENFRNQTTHNPEVGSDERFLAIMETSRRCSVLPRLDSRSPEEIIGYNENGIPT